MSKQEFIIELNQLFSNKVGNEDYKVVDGVYDTYNCDIHILMDFNCNIYYKKSIGQDAGWERCRKCKLHSGCNVCKEFLDLIEKYGYSFDWIYGFVAGLWKKKMPIKINNEMLIDNFDDNYIGILLFQYNQEIYEKIEKKINKLIKQNKCIVLVDLLSFTKKINKQLFKKWSVEIIMKSLEEIVLYINPTYETNIVRDVSIIYKYKK